ncbi:alpha/beta fold hydrolase [Mesobacterium pallidum]|uniref:alpha/beta fold hydrolase n=1 Tax=Mesobacterium pallidum TaxID=2872037 RepID=UPI001EE22E51|nr:alpha/beta hydrolase [Mesobacterium pallidum]
MPQDDPIRPTDAVEIQAVTITTEEGMRLAADIAGDPWQPRLIFVHGGGQSRRSWRKAVRTMVTAGYSVVSYDLRGHGESDWSPDADYGLDAHVRDLGAVIRAAPTPPAVIGASLGGRVALAAAAEQAAGTVRALVLVDMAPRVARAGLERVARFLDVSAGGFDSIQQAAATLERYAEREIGHNYFRLSHSLTTGHDGRIYWKWDPRLAQPAFLLPENIEGYLSDCARALRCPALLVRGTKSDIVDDDSVAHFVRTQPSAEVAEIEGASHLMSTGQLSVFCDATLTFLDRMVRRTA